MEVKVQEEPRKATTKIEEDHEETNGQDNGNSPYDNGDLSPTSRPLKTEEVLTPLKCSPGPLDLHPKQPQNSQSENAQEASMSSSSEDQVRQLTSSSSPAGDVLPPSKPDSEAAVLSAPTPCCSLLPETSTKEVLPKDHPPSSSCSVMSGKEVPGKKPLDIPRSSPSLVSASSRPCKRKISMPLVLPLPPVQWGRCELPPPCKLPCLATDKNPVTLKNTKCQGNEMNKTKIKRHFSATQSAPSISQPESVTADSLPLTTRQVCATTASLADPCTGTPTVSVCPSSLTPNINQETRHTVPHVPVSVHADLLPAVSSHPASEIPLNAYGGLSYSAITTTAPVSDPTPPRSSNSSFQPPSCEMEPPTPMCVDSPPSISSLTPLPVPSTSTFISTVQATTSMAVFSVTTQPSAILTSQTTSESVVDMDTTPPTQAVNFGSPPDFSTISRPANQVRRRLRKRNSAKLEVSSTSLSASKDSHLMLHRPSGPQTTSQPTSKAHYVQLNRTLISRYPVNTGVFHGNSAVTPTVAGTTSANVSLANDIEAMDTTPPSQAVILHSALISLQNHGTSHEALSSGSTPLAGVSTHLPSKLVSRGIQVSSQHTSGATGVQQPKMPVRILRFPAQAAGITSTAQQATSSMMQSDGSSLQSPDYTVNTQMAFGGKLRILPTDTSTTARIGVSTTMPNTGNSSSAFARTSPGPVVIMGCAAPRDGGSLAVSMSTPGPTHSQANRALIVGAGLSKAHSTPSISQLGHTTWNLSDCNMAAAAGKTSTTPVPGYPSSISHQSTRNPPVHITHDVVMGGDDSIPTTADSSVHTVHQYTCCLPRRGKPPTLKRTATMMKNHVSGDMSVSTSRRTTLGSPGYTTLSSPMQHPSEAMGRDNNIPIIGGPVIPTFLQHSSGPLGQNMSGALRGNTTLRAMRVRRVTTGHQNTQSPAVRTTCTATRGSTVPSTAGNSHGNPVTQSTSGTPNQSSSATGGSTMHF
ncbi:nuclear pore-associated protein 1-like [Pteropus medius]|uniref:nuclear pore-associated protein 1-like n=1 Tax=Pteropus vampyrus TaxID=132908 RepID=UPI00196A5831|nr:nuclear pore-associated protein 1-like [Pteropus giganteus]